MRAADIRTLLEALHTYRYEAEAYDDAKATARDAERQVRSEDTDFGRMTRAIHRNALTEQAKAEINLKNAGVALEQAGGCALADLRREKLIP